MGEASLLRSIPCPDCTHGEPLGYGHQGGVCGNSKCERCNGWGQVDVKVIGDAEFPSVATFAPAASAGG